MSTYSRFVICTSFLLAFLLWPKPAAAFYGFFSDIGPYDDDSNALSGYAFTWEDWWDAYGSPWCSYWEWDPYTEQEYCTEYVYSNRNVEDFAWVFTPSSDFFAWAYGIGPLFAIASYSVNPPDETVGTWTAYGDHFIEEDSFALYYDPWDEGWHTLYTGHATYYIGTSGAQTQVRPRVRVTGGNTIWYFGGQNPAGYPTSIMLTSTAGSSTTWSVIEGGGKVILSPPGQTETITVTSSASPSSGSAFFSLPPGGDIKITATANGATSLLTSRTPHQLIPFQMPENECDVFLPGGPGVVMKYLTTIHYEILDNLDAPLPPISIGVNEQLGTIVPIFSGNNWPPNLERPFSTDNSTMRDFVGVPEDATSWTPPATCRTGTGVGVWKRGQIWRVGSETTAAGRMVQSGLLTYYTDFGDVVEIISPLLP